MNLMLHDSNYLSRKLYFSQLKKKKGQPYYLLQLQFEF
jgi:hypothetical protein